MAIVAYSGVAVRPSVRAISAVQTSSKDNDHGPGVWVMLRGDVPSTWEHPLLESVASLDFVRRRIFFFPARDARRLELPKPEVLIPSTRHIRCCCSDAKSPLMGIGVHEILLTIHFWDTAERWANAKQDDNVHPSACATAAVSGKTSIA